MTDSSGGPRRGVAFFVVVASASALLAVPGGASAGHLSCGDVVEASTTLDEDLTCAGPGDGLIIGADGLTLDLGGHTITGELTGSPFEGGLHGGIGINNGGGYDAVRVVNGTVTNFLVGVRLTGADGNRLSGLRVVRNGDGAVLASSDRNAIIGSDLSHNGFGPSDVGDGIALTDGSDRNLIRTTVAGDAEGRGIFIVDSAENVVERSTAGGGIGGLEAYGAPGTTARRSTFDSGFTTVVLSGSDRSSISRSDIRGGLQSWSNSVRLARNTIRWGGIDVLGPDNTIVRNTVIANVFGSGIYVAGTGALIADNVANLNIDDGITVTAPGTVVRGNTANNNSLLGINAVPGVVDGGHNTASGNGNPLQCLNIDCD